MNTPIIKIGIAEDECLVRQGIVSIVNSLDKITITLEAENGIELIQSLSGMANKPEIVLMDLNMPEMNGIECTKEINRQFPDIKIIALTSYYSHTFIKSMFQLGAASYLKKSVKPSVLEKTIRQVHENGFYYAPEVIKIIHQNMTKITKPITNPKFDSISFTKREMEVLQLICAQLTNSEISDKLFISPRTVEGHRNNLLAKTESKNVVGLVLYALQHQLVAISEPVFQ